MALKNFQYEAIMRDYNQKQFLHKHEQDEHIRTAEEKSRLIHDNGVCNFVDSAYCQS